jgi:hypothetical protein
MNRSRYGRNDLSYKNALFFGSSPALAATSNSSTQVPSLTHGLLAIYNDLKANITFNYFNYQAKDPLFTIYKIKEFYEKSIDLIKKSTYDQVICLSNSFSSTSSNSSSCSPNNSFKFLTNGTTDLLLFRNQDIIIICYLALFDIDFFDNSNSDMSALFYKIRQLIHLFETQTFSLVQNKTSKFNLNLKIYTYLFILYKIIDFIEMSNINNVNNINNNNININRNSNEIKNRLIDLISSELICFNKSATTNINSLYLQWLQEVFTLVNSYAQI